jgi:uncharacterized protein YoaH (UPF0181 family)
MTIYEARFSFPGIESFFSPRRHFQNKELVIEYVHTFFNDKHFSATVSAYNGSGRNHSDHVGLAAQGLSSVEALKNLAETIRREIDHKREPESVDFVELREETPFDASMIREGNIYVRARPCEGKAGGIQTAVLLRQEVNKVQTYFPIFSMQTDSFGKAIAYLSRIDFDADFLKNFKLGVKVKSLLP